MFVNAGPPGTEAEAYAQQVIELLPDDMAPETCACSQLHKDRNLSYPKQCCSVTCGCAHALKVAQALTLQLHAGASELGSPSIP